MTPVKMLEPAALIFLDHIGVNVLLTAECADPNTCDHDDNEECTVGGHHFMSCQQMLAIPKVLVSTLVSVMMDSTLHLLPQHSIVTTYIVKWIHTHTPIFTFTV